MSTNSNTVVSAVDLLDSDALAAAGKTINEARSALFPSLMDATSGMDGDDAAAVFKDAEATLKEREGTKTVKEALGSKYDVYKTAKSLCLRSRRKFGAEADGRGSSDLSKALRDAAKAERDAKDPAVKKAGECSLKGNVVADGHPETQVTLSLLAEAIDAALVAGTSDRTVADILRSATSAIQDTHRKAHNPEPAERPAFDVTGLTIAQLRELAADNNITLPSKARKAELQKAIQQAQVA